MNQGTSEHIFTSRYEEIIIVKNKAARITDEPNQQTVTPTIICREANFIWHNQPAEIFAFNRHLFRAQHQHLKEKMF